nr:TonB-dependent receptor [Saprospiraceae bacterium]
MIKKVFILLFVLHSAGIGMVNQLCSSGIVAPTEDHQVDSMQMSIDFPQVIIQGNRQGVFSDIPGSVSRIEGSELQRISPLSANEALRRFTGVHLQDEEGAGLRMNLGVRGLDPDRSRNILVLEDGIPVALKPYGEPEMYYSPAIERMSGLEIIKGSGQVLYGPQTIGGVMNYITADPPDELGGRVIMQTGGGGYFSGMGSLGSTVGNTGFNINYLYKRADKLGYVGFNIHDLNAKFRIEITDRSILNVKVGTYSETSNSTYIGLTQTMYDAGDQDHVLMAPDDRLVVGRESASLAHQYRVHSDLNINTTLFGYKVSRNWQRQDFSYNPDAPNQTGVVWGDPGIPGGAVYMQGSTGNRNRSFEVFGAESRFTWNYRGFLAGAHQLRGGVRLMRERAFEQRINGSKPDASSGILRNDEIRTGTGYSAFVQNKLQLTSRWSVSTGVRMEVYDYEREILRGPFGGEIVDTTVVNRSSVTSVIPGLGFNYSIDRSFTLFGGIHRGFSPPRVKDAISSTGQVVELDAELSWNSELGLRYRTEGILSGELTAFLMDFSNQIIPVSESSGGTGAGLVNAGETRHLGLEAQVGLNFSRFLPDGYQLTSSTAITGMRSTFSSDRFFTVNGEEVNANGNRTPYAPQFILNQQLAFSTPGGWGISVIGHYLGDQFTDVINSIEPAPNGRSGKIDSYLNLDANLLYEWTDKNVVFNLSVKNITDSRHIVSRRPTGIRVATPRLVTGGVDFRF